MFRIARNFSHYHSRSRFDFKHEWDNQASKPKSVVQPIIQTHETHTSEPHMKISELYYTVNGIRQGAYTLSKTYKSGATSIISMVYIDGKKKGLEQKLVNGRVVSIIDHDGIFAPWSITKETNKPKQSYWVDPDDQ